MQTIPAQPVAFQGTQTRQAFIKKTYMSLMSAIACFTLIEIALFKSGVAEKIAITLSQNWIFVMIAFVVAGMAASRAAFMSQSKTTQYIALYSYVVIEALIFIPILYIANYKAGGGVIQSAAAITLIAFAALTAIVFVSKKDFSFLGSLLKWAGIMAMMFMVGGWIFGFHLGTFFSVGMVGLAGGFILYDTSNILHK